MNEYVYDPAVLNKAEKYVALAKELGAADAVVFEAPQICWDSRTLLKCMYGCSDWGKGLTCPSRPGNPSMAEIKEMFSRYSWVSSFTATKAASQRISMAIEKAAFLDNYYFAMSLSDCALCKECAGFQGGECRHVALARPAFHSIGIDVFKTVHQLGLPLFALQDRSDPRENWYSAVFME